ncbi:MAG: hypothetical protein ABJB05_14350 [Parafilimonas sp.]
MIELKKHDSFFDYWHYNEIDVVSKKLSQKKAEEIAQSLKLKEVYKELPEHCFQLLFVS